MRNLAGVRCETIAGYIKTKQYQIGSAGSVNHDWNAIWLNSNCWMVRGWQVVVERKFANNLFYEPGVIDNIQLLSPDNGIIRPKKGDTIHFVIKYTDAPGKVQINSNLFRNLTVKKQVQVPRRRTTWALPTFALSRQRYSPFTQKGTCFFFDYVVIDPVLKYLDILFDFAG